MGLEILFLFFYTVFMEGDYMEDLVMNNRKDFKTVKLDSPIIKVYNEVFEDMMKKCPERIIIIKK